MKSWVLLGAKEGSLGGAFRSHILQQCSEDQCHVISRRTEPAFDFSQERQWPAVLEYVKTTKPTNLIYFAAGGPYGSYWEKSWDSHYWALRTTLLFPMFLLHQLQDVSSLKQVVLCGSAVAEDRADPGATSYSVSKHGLFGLWRNLCREEQLNWDLRLFSPSYMDTTMLPPRARVRQEQPEWVLDRDEVAKQLFWWLCNSEQRNSHWRLDSPT